MKRAAGESVDYVITWLEMTAPPAAPPVPQPLGAGTALLLAPDPPPWYFLALYDAVGAGHAWEDMHLRDPADLAAWLADPATALWTLLREGWPQGFFLLDWRAPGLCDLAYLGLVPQAVGQGLGRYLLDVAIRTGWARDGVGRMTVNTCTLDHPRALAMYQRAGFTVRDRTTHSRVLRRPLDLPHLPE